MYILAAFAITVLGTFSRSFRQCISGVVFWLCAALTLTTIYGMFLP